MNREPAIIVAAVQGLILAIIGYVGYTLSAGQTEILGMVLAVVVPFLISIISGLVIRLKAWADANVTDKVAQTYRSGMEAGRDVGKDQMVEKIHPLIQRAVSDALEQQAGSLDRKVSASLDSRLGEQIKLSEVNETGG